MSRPAPDRPAAPHHAPVAAEVELWRASLAGAADEARAHRHLLAADEVARAARFRFARDADRFVAARAALRRCLGRYLGVPPDAVPLAVAPAGKPVLRAGERADADLRFNVSHSGELLLIAVAGGRDVGVDVERLRDVPEWADIAARHFAPGERAALHAAADPPAAFFALWVRKEACVKALGSGLGMPLDGFEVPLRAEAPAEVRWLAGDGDATPRLAVHAIEVPAGYVAAVAVVGGAATVRCADLPP